MTGVMFALCAMIENREKKGLPGDLMSNFIAGNPLMFGDPPYGHSGAALLEGLGVFLYLPSCAGTSVVRAACAKRRLPAH